MLEPAILVALAGETSHGYDLRSSVKDLTRGFLDVDPGGLYRVLRRMEDDGLVSSTWTEGEHGPQRRTYRITESGRSVLGPWAEQLRARRAAFDGLLQAIERVQDASGTNPAGPTDDEENSDAAR